MLFDFANLYLEGQRSFAARAAAPARKRGEERRGSLGYARGLSLSRDAAPRFLDRERATKWQLSLPSRLWAAFSVDLSVLVPSRTIFLRVVDAGRPFPSFVQYVTKYFEFQSFTGLLRDSKLDARSNARLFASRRDDFPSSRALLKSPNYMIPARRRRCRDARMLSNIAPAHTKAENSAFLPLPYNRACIMGNFEVSHLGQVCVFRRLDSLAGPARTRIPRSITNSPVRRASKRAGN